MLNRFCLLSKPQPSVLKGQYQNGWNINQNQIKNTIFLHCISQLLRVLRKKDLQDTATRSLISCFILHFTPEDIIFHRFLELYSTLSEKKIFVTNFLLSDSLKRIPPYPINSQNPLRVTKVFDDTPLTVISIYWVDQFIYSSLLAFSVHIFEQQTRRWPYSLTYFMRKKCPF